MGRDQADEKRPTMRSGGRGIDPSDAVQFRNRSCCDAATRSLAVICILVAAKLTRSPYRDLSGLADRLPRGDGFPLAPCNKLTRAPSSDGVPSLKQPSAAREGQPECGHLLAVANQQD